MNQSDRVSDKLWVFGHPVNSLKGCAGLSGDSKVSPIEAMNDFGARNLFYVMMGRPADIVRYNEEAVSAARIGWSVDGSVRLEDILAQAKVFPNIDRALFDNFFSAENSGNNWKKYSLQDLMNIRDRLHAAGLEMWVVYYTMQSDLDAGAYLELFDGVTFWFWDEPSNDYFDRSCEQFIRNTPGKKRLIGCYLYNFGQSREATADSVLHQLDREKDLIDAGLIDGIILHTNAVGGLGFGAYEAAKKWTDLHKDDFVKTVRPL